MKPKTSLCDRLGGVAARTLAVGALLALALNTSAGLTHRYSFTTDATDSISGAVGILHGATAISDGAANFFGTAVSGPDCDYIELPSGLISNYTTVTFELWVNVGANGNWSEIYAFGNQTAGGAGANMLMVCPHSGSSPADFRMSYAQAAPGYTDEKVVNGVGVLDDIGPVCLTCVYDPPNNSMSLYTNGMLVGTLSPVTTGTKQFSLTNVYNVHSWLGRSLYNGDSAYVGSVDEFRIYDKPLTPLEVYVHSTAGPDNVVTNIVINSLSWNADSNMVVGSRQSSTVTFNTASYGSVTLPNATEPTYSSGNPAIVKVTAQGQLFAMAVGSATVSAVYNGTTNRVVVTVEPPKLLHRYSFTTDAKDSVGTAHGTLKGTASISGGSLVLPGGSSSDPDPSYLDLPNGMLASLTAMTFEAWVTDTGSLGWARVWDFGNSSGGEDVSNGGSRFIYLALPNGGTDIQGNIHVNDRGGDASVTAPRPPVGTEVHVVWSSDIANQTSWLYVNGSLVAVNKATTVAPSDLGVSLNDWLGRSQYADPLFTGSINEFRIYNGAVSPMQVSLDAASGPDTVVSDPGAVQTLRPTMGTNQVDAGGLPVQLTVYADYANITNVNVTTLPGIVYQSSDTSILTVTSSGSLLGAGAGNATITVTFGGKSQTLAVKVNSLANYSPATMIHRYSFSESAGSTAVKDSVGTADGTVVGNGAVFNGKGQLTLPGGTSSSADATTISGYVDLPNHIINSLTNVSFETWMTYDSASQWQRIFDFGTSDGGEDVSSGNGNYLFLSPQGSGNNYQFSVRDPATSSEPAPLIASAPLPTGQKVYLAVVYNYTANVAQLFRDGALVASGTAPVDLTTIDDVNNWLGRSQWGDPMLAGTLDEFRIWNGTLLPSEIATHYAAGPNALTPGAKIAWVSFHPADGTPSANATTAGFTKAPDVGYTELLAANGHQVTRIITSGTPDTNLLNTFDLVMISRSVPSGDYQDAPETKAWNGITAPTMVMGGYVLRNSRLGYTAGATIPDTTNAAVRLSVKNPAHPIFDGVALDATSTMVNTYATMVSFTNLLQQGISVNTDPVAGGGTILATIGTAGDPAFNGMVIGEWQAGAKMANTAGDILGGHRLVFLSGSRERTITSEGAGIFDLTLDGSKLFLNAVKYMTRPAAPKFTSIKPAADGKIAIAWTGGGTLQTAPTVTGPWQDVPGATSPYTFTPTSAMLFGRILQ